jgi:Kef-type K+ transport system membrane component KefB
MNLLAVSFELPITDPVLIFALVLFIILFIPLFFQRIRIPAIVGIILAGVLVGPNGLNILQRSSSIILFGTVCLWPAWKWT